MASEQKRAQILDDEVLHIPHGPCNVAFTYNNISVQLVRLNKIGRSSDQFVGDEPSLFAESLLCILLQKSWTPFSSICG